MSSQQKPSRRTGRTVAAFKKALEDNLSYARGQALYDATAHDVHVTLAYTVRYQSYTECQDRAAEAYLDQEAWTPMSILNVARCGFFSPDRSMRQYREDIWKANPVKVES